MLEPYRMAIINLIASSLVVIGLLFYRYVFPKKPINLFLLLTIVSLLPLISILRKGTYESGDFNFHLYRTMAFYDSLKDGRFLPSWAGDLNATYGYPLFIFNYAFPYYITSLFHAIGFSFIASMKLYLIIVFVLSGIFMYLWSKNVLKNNLAAFTASIFYLFAPYHLVDLHFRVTLGELSVFALLPLLLLSIDKIIASPNRKTVLLAGTVYALLNLAHLGTAVFSLVLIVPYIIFSMMIYKKFTLKNYVIISLPFIIGIILSSYLWLPYITHVQYTHGNELISGVVSFIPLRELVYSPWRYGLLFQGPKGELALIIGYTQLVLAVLCAFLLIAKKIQRKNRPHAIFWLAFFLLFFFMITPQSREIWKMLPTVNVVQFSYRLLLPATLCMSMLAGFVTLHYIKKQWIIFVIIFLTISYTMLNWGHRRVIPEIDDTALKKSQPISSAYGEGFCCLGSPRWVDKNDPWIKKVPEKHIEILSGKGEINIIFRNSIRHEYVVSAENEVYIKENTLYFPGWKVKDNSKNLTINYQNPKYKGIITFTLPKGLHFLEVYYEDLLSQKIAKKISLTGFLLIAFYFFFSFGRFLSKKSLNFISNKNNFLFSNFRKQRKG